MERVTKILKIVLQVMMAISMLIILGVSLFTAYIVLAPDNLPKPFRLMYDLSTQQPQTVNVADFIPVEPTPTPIVYEPGEGIMFPTGTKIINLADPSGNKYIRVTIVLEYEPPEEMEELEGEKKAEFMTELNAELESLAPVVDDAIITLLSTKTYEDLYTAEGKELLRSTLLEAINSRLSTHHVISLYFTEFVVE